MKLRMAFYTNGTNPIANYFALQSGVLEVNVWYHFIICVGADGDVRTWINGERFNNENVTTGLFTTRPANATNIVPVEGTRRTSFIGVSIIPSADSYLTGAYLGGFRIWRKTLSAAEVADLRAGNSVTGTLSFYYTFDEAPASKKAADLSGFQRNATVSGDVSFVKFSSWPSFALPAPQALLFGTAGGNAGERGMEIPILAEVRLPLTIEVVFSITALQSTGARILDLGAGEADKNLLLYFVQDSAVDSNFLALKIYTGTTASNVVELFKENGAGVIVPDTWYHAVIVMETGVGTTYGVKSYLNNVTYPASSALNATLQYITRTKNYLGKSNWLSDPYMTEAFVSGLRLWSTTLSAADVASLFAGAGAAGSVLVEYRFDGSGTTVKDYSGNKLDATIFGDATIAPTTVDPSTATGVPLGSCGLQFGANAGRTGLSIAGPAVSLSNFTLELWLQQTSPQVGGARLFEVGGSGGSSADTLYMAAYPDFVRLGVFDSAGAESYTDLFKITKGLPTQNWTHVMITVESTPGSASGVDIKSYLNFALVDTKGADWQAALASISAVSTRGYVGGSSGAPAELQNVTLGYVRLWSAAENVTILKSNYTALPSGDLQMFYRLDEPPHVLRAADVSRAGASREAALAGPNANFSCAIPVTVTVDLNVYVVKLRFRAPQSTMWAGPASIDTKCVGAPVNFTAALHNLQQRSSFAIESRKVSRPSQTFELYPGFRYTCTSLLSVVASNQSFVVATLLAPAFSTPAIPPALPLQPPTPTLLFYSDQVLVVQKEVLYPPISFCDLYILVGNEVLGHAVAAAPDLQTVIGRRASMRGLKHNTNYTFFSRCTNDAGVADGPPREPLRPFRSRASNSSFSLLIYKPYIPPYYKYPAGSFVCKAFIVGIDSGAMRAEIANVTLDEFGAASFVQRDISSYPVGSSRAPVGLGKYQIVSMCSNIYGVGPDSITTVFTVTDGVPPSAPTIVSVESRIKSAIVTYRPALSSIGELQHCSGTVGGADSEVFRTARVLNDREVNRGDGSQLYCIAANKTDADVCGSLEEGAIKDVSVLLSDLQPRTTYTLVVTCSNLNGPGIEATTEFTTNYMPPPSSLKQVASEAQYVSVSFEPGNGGGLRVERCSLFVNGALTSTVDVASQQPIIATNPKVFELKPKTSYGAVVECSNPEATAQSQSLTVQTKDSSVLIDFSKIKNLTTNDRGELVGTVVNQPPSCKTRQAKHCLYPDWCNKQPGVSHANLAYQKCRRDASEFCRVIKLGVHKFGPKYPQWYTISQCPPDVKTVVAGYPVTLKVSVVGKKRALLQATGADACISKGIIQADPANGIECGLYEDTRGEPVSGNSVTVCRRVNASAETDDIVGSKYCFASANKIIDPATGKVSVNMPEDLPEAHDLAPVDAQSRRLLQADGDSGPVFNSQSGYDMSLKDTRTGDTVTIVGGAVIPAKTSGIGMPTGVYVSTRTYRSITVSFDVPPISGVNSAGDLLSINTCSLLSLDMGGSGATTEVARAAVPLDSQGSPAASMKLVADKLAPGTAYRLAVVCSNAYGDGNVSAAVQASTKQASFVLSGEKTAASPDGTFSLPGGRLLNVAPGAGEAARTACLPGSYISLPTVRLGTFSSDGTPLAESPSMGLAASLSPPIDAASPQPATQLCVVLPGSPFASASSTTTRRLSAAASASTLSLGTPYDLALSDATSTVVVKDAVMWQRAGSLNFTTLNCTSAGALVRCRRRAGAGSVVRIPVRAAGAPAGTVQLSWPGTFTAAPTQVHVGSFDGAGNAICAASATDVRVADGSLVFKVPDSPPSGCEVGPSRTRALLMTTDSQYAVRIRQADGEIVILDEVFVWIASPTALSAWGANEARTGSAAGGSGNNKDLGIGLGLGLGLGFVLALAAVVWFTHRRKNSARPAAIGTRPGADPDSNGVVLPAAHVHGQYSTVHL
eukprot:tig00000254_g22490.t1